MAKSARSSSSSSGPITDEREIQIDLIDRWQHTPGVDQGIIASSAFQDVLFRRSSTGSGSGLLPISPSLSDLASNGFVFDESLSLSHSLSHTNPNRSLSRFDGSIHR